MYFAWMMQELCVPNICATLALQVQDAVKPAVLADINKITIDYGIKHLPFSSYHASGIPGVHQVASAATISNNHARGCGNVSIL